MKLLQKGAEGEVFLDVWYGLRVVRKVRMPKRYRVVELDTELRHARTAREAWIMHEAKIAGVSTPMVYSVNLEIDEIVMQYLDGCRLREFLESAEKAVRSQFCRMFGETVARLHNSGIIHGDLTTSNVIVKGSKVYLIDFGLSEYSTELEKRGVDILLGQRVFHSTHHAYGDLCYAAFLGGYREQIGRNVADEVEEKVREIIRRGRYAIER